MPKYDRQTLRQKIDELRKEEEKPTGETNKAYLIYIELKIHNLIQEWTEGL